MSAEEKNKALVRRFFEARTKADLNAIEEMMARVRLDLSGISMIYGISMRSK
jgi:hypothetical protein